MKRSFLLIISLIILACSETEDAATAFDIPTYFELVNTAELQICAENYQQAVAVYDKAFQNIDKPFGKDVFNAALAGALAEDRERMFNYLQRMVNNVEELNFVRSIFSGPYVTKPEWEQLLANREIAYDPELRQKYAAIFEKDQLFRPLYNTHRETIEANREENMHEILAQTALTGFPSHQELGYTERLRGQDHYIVLHHTAQRRSRDKTIMDLEPLLKEAVSQGRFEPESAILYLHFQNDSDKGPFELFSTWQYKHPLLPDSLNNKLWIRRQTSETLAEVDRVRSEWFASTSAAVAQKAAFLERNRAPFMFSSMHRSVGNLAEDMDRETALEQYRAFTRQMIAYE